MLTRNISLLFLGLGVFILMQVLLPVLSFQIWEWQNSKSESVLIDSRSASGTEIGSLSGVSLENVDNFPAFIGRDSSLPPPAYKDFKISVPSLNLKEIEAKVNSNQFEDYLGHLPGTALPGEKGNVFISGHSSLSLASILQVRSRKAYFAGLQNTKKGENIFVEALGQKFTYEVIGIRVVDPKDLSVLNPPDNIGRFLTLMTCVPPGFNTKRLVVLARLKE